VTTGELATVEARLRAAYADATATVQPDGLRSDVPERWHTDPGQPGRRQPMLTALLAAAAVVLIAVTAVVVPGVVRTGSQGNGGPFTPLPGYMVTIPGVSDGRLDVENAVTGTLTATVKTPVQGAYWYSLAALGPRTFGAGLVEGGRTDFYQFVLTDAGQVASVRRIGKQIGQIVMGASITPDGKYVGYIALIVHGGSGVIQVRISNLATGKVTGAWPVPVDDSIKSLAINAAGTAMAVSAYSYGPSLRNGAFNTHANLVQWTSVLTPGTSGTSIDKLPDVSQQASQVALSPDGRTLYEFLQVGRVTGASWRDRKPVTFELAAIAVGTGKIVSVLHTWRAAWADFDPQLALGPAGRYLLILSGTTMARVDLSTGRYMALPGRNTTLQPPETSPSLNLGSGKDSVGQGGDINPIAW
jgi:hypothetical protein